MEERSVPLMRNGERIWRLLQWERLPDRNYRIALDGPSENIDVIGRDLFAALQDVRRHLEAEGWTIAVQGSRVDTHPSGMIRETIGARKIYVLENGRHVRSEHLVDIFDEADVEQIGTVDEQIEFYGQWKISRAAIPPST